MKVYAIGNITLDIVFKSIDDMPAWGVEIPVKNITYRVAGNLGNFSLALKKIGIAPFIIGNLGGDDNGKFILKELNKNGLDTSTIRIEKKYKTSVTATIVKKDGERSFITYAGQLLKIDRNFIFDSLNKIEPNSIAILCSLFQFPNLKIKDIIEFFKMLKQKNCIILLDPGWDINGWDKQTISDVKKLLRYVDIFLPNLEEAREITKINDEIKIIRYLKKEGSKDLIIKMGKQGATACIDNKIFKSET
ncbi:MAG: carbohydrate kinase family protein, partial [Actinobacteria bacterium]|nr:carbohydrate kinase family protein [Actinomycetota bacterium]